MSSIDRIVVFTGVYSTVQSVIQMTVAALALAQYFCVIDWLQRYAPLVWVNVLYFSNYACRPTINVGSVVRDMPDQAFVYIDKDSIPTTKNLIINGLYLGIGLLWLVSSVVLVAGGARRDNVMTCKIIWLVVTTGQCGIDLAAIISYASDIWHTQTLSDLVDYIGGTLSGAGNQNVDTTSATILMLGVYTRYGFNFLLHGFLFIFILVNTFKRRVFEELQFQSVLFDNEMKSSSLRLPRVRLNSASESNAVAQPTRESTPTNNNVDFTDETVKGTVPPPPPMLAKEEKKHIRTVNFPKSLMSLPQRLEIIMAEQQRKLNSSVVDTVSNRGGSPVREPDRQTNDEEPQPSTSLAARLRERRGTNATLVAQLPWSYIPTPLNRMRDQLPPDEELPPVPVPDYTLHPSYRKASVHRANSSVSKTTANELENTAVARSPTTNWRKTDVLY